MIWPTAVRWQAYSHARRLYIETGDQDAFDNMLRFVTLEGDFWKILGDDPNICNRDGRIEIVTEKANQKAAYQAMTNAR